MTSCFVAIECQPEEFNAFQHMAASRGMTMAEWLVMIGKANVPTAVWEQLDPSIAQLPGSSPKEVFDVQLEQAYKALDQIDEEAGVAPLPIEVKPTPLPAKVVTNDVAPHPCAHLAPTYPNGFNARTCQGTCTSRSKHGAPCYFTAQVARQCEFFKGKIIKR